MGYDYEIAKKVLTENDKNRLMCLYLNCNPTAIDWDKAAKDFGSASVASMRVMTSSALKKIENAGGKNGVEPSPSKATPRKRKAKDDADDTETPTGKKRGGKARKSASPARDDEKSVKEEEND